MWIRFNLPCDGSTQQRLHKIFRREIKEWKNRNLVKGAVLTYHFKTPSVTGDSLYVCLDIPAVKTPHEHTVQLDERAVRKIPSEIMYEIKQVCEENLIELGITDYEFDITTAKSRGYYRNAPTEEIIHFASAGTNTAFDLLDMIEKHEITLTNHEKLAEDILSRLKQKLGDNYFWLREAFHFVCNTMLFDDRYLWSLIALQQT
jgi:hypothetical protein